MEKANPFPSERVDALGKNSENIKTLRFELSLTESDEKKCPEFSFLDLVKAATVGKVYVFRSYPLEPKLFYH